jgi:glycosyltransferase involved in cell wall biosynthesis
MAKVCIVRHAYYPQETHVRRNAETLIQQGHQVYLICLQDNNQAFREVLSGVNIYRLPIHHYRRGLGRYLFEYSLGFLLVFFTLGWLHLSKRFDVVEVDSMPDFLVFSCILPKWMGARIVLYLFESMPEYFALKYNLSNSHWSVKLMKWVEHQAIAFADSAITVDEAFRSAIVVRGTPKEKISVILNVPNDQSFRTAREVYQIPPNKAGFTVITHGTLLELYGIQFIIRAIARLRQQIPGVNMIIAGDGEYGPELKHLAHELLVDDIIRFTGWISQSEVIQLILGADIGVVATFGSYGEICVPNKLFEYIALGKPVVCSSLKAIRDYFAENSLFYFQPTNIDELTECIYRVYQHPESAVEMKENANRVYNENQWGVSKNIYIDVLIGLS